MGCRWDEISTPFVRLEDGRAIAHVGLLEIPLVVAGRERRVGGIHAVATHPERRRRGLYRSVMEEALAYAATRYETLVLTTEEPYLYEPFGFRTVAESRFFRSCDKHETAACMRLVDRENPSDLALLHRLLEERAPVSERLGVVRDHVVFGFDEAYTPLRYDSNGDLLLVYDVVGTTLRLFDVVAKSIPPLGEIVVRIPERLLRVEVYFAPDRLGAKLDAEPWNLDDVFFMARGPLAVEPGAFMLPRTARF
jgi:predicted N-acetyltransferase YhbS